MSNQSLAYINVPVATLWTSYESPRVMDQIGLSNPCAIREWISSMDDDKKLELCTQNLVQSQALFGEQVIILDKRDKWAYVALKSQSSSKNEEGYPGWIPQVQLTEGTMPASDDGRVAVIQASFTTLYDKQLRPMMELCFQTILPYMKQQEDWVIVSTPFGEEGWIQAKDVFICSSIEEKKGNGKEIVQQGERFLGLAYFWGGMSAYGYDCSGFSYTMCKANGYIIPRDAHEQAVQGKSVPLGKIEPGDLLFFGYEEGKGAIHHVGIYYGDNKLLHSPNTGKNIEIIEMAGTLYERELCVARRYWVERGF